MNAIIYVRQSLDKIGDGKGVARQREDCERLCKDRGWTVTQIIEDNDTSASVGRRSGFESLLDCMKRGECDVVVAWHIDRLLRKMTDLERVIDLSEKTGIKVATVSGDISLDTDMGRLVGRIVAAVARGEVERKSTRHKRANQQKAEAGLPHGSRRPFGYQSNMLEIKWDEAEVLRAMAGRVVAGWSCKDVAFWANEQGHTTSTGKPFYPVTVRNMLMKERYGGLRTYNGQTYKATWPAVFTPDEWETLQLTLRLRSERVSDHAQPPLRKYLLTGLLVCGSCGNHLNGSAKRDRASSPLRRTYLCRVTGDTKREGGCGGVRRNADALDHYVREAILDKFDVPDLHTLVDSSYRDGSQLRELVEKRQSAKDRLDQLVDDYADGTLSKAAYSRARERVSAALSDVEREIESIHRSRLPIALSAGETVREAWQGNGMSWRRALVDMLIDSITVKPTAKKPYYIVDNVRMRFDPTAIAIQWRQ